MDFTREPIIETVVSAREGCKLAIRNSKGVSQEEYFVEAIEVVSFGNALFYRSLERPKSFLVPVTDYEVVELRETRVVLKTAGTKAKTGATAPKAEKQAPAEKPEKPEKKRERRKSRRRPKGESDEAKESTPEEKSSPTAPVNEEAKPETVPAPEVSKKVAPAITEAPPALKVAPPTALISDTLQKYKEDELYRGAFFTRDEASKEEGSAEPAKEESLAEPVKEEGATATAPATEDGQS